MPCFHASYGGQEVKIAIKPIRIIEGKLSKRALSLVLEWAALHQQELLEAWELARAEQPLNKIDPLK